VSIIINRSPLSLIAGLGAAATILMLVFKDTSVGVVSGIQLTANDMLRKGDWIQMDKNGANGIVQDVNITTVKVKNWDNTITTISPFTLMNDSFRNWRGMQNSAGRLATPTLTIDMNSMALISDEQKAEYLANNLISESEMQKPIVNLTVYQRAMLKYLQSDERINTQYNHMVRQIPSPTQGMGLTIQLYFFLKDKKWENYERNKDEILSYAIVALKHYGLEIYQLQKLA
jgi:miniconductance mechanosensitive channel